MSLFPDTPNTLLDELTSSAAFDDTKWMRFDELYRPVLRTFLLQRFPSLAGEVDDFTQETMMRLVRVLRSGHYDASKAHFRTFLATIINNLAVDALRRQDRFAALPLSTIDWVTPPQKPTPAHELLDRQWQEACYAAARRHLLHRMSLPQHYPEIWRALEKGERAADIAARLHLDPAFVRQVKHRLTDMFSALVASYKSSREIE